MSNVFYAPCPKCGQSVTVTTSSVYMPCLCGAILKYTGGWYVVLDGKANSIRTEGGSDE
jgi:hypothetical protein